MTSSLVNEKRTVYSAVRNHSGIRKTMNEYVFNENTVVYRTAPIQEILNSRYPSVVNISWRKRCTDDKTLKEDDK